LNDWGLNSSIRISDTLSKGRLIISADVSGGDGSYLYNWGNGFQRYSGFIVCPSQDTTIKLITQSISIGEKKKALVEVDTSYLKIRVHGSPSCDYILNENGELEREYLDKEGNHYKILSKNGSFLEVKQMDGMPSSLRYISGFEISLKNWEELGQKEIELKKMVEMIPDSSGELLQVNSIQDTEKELFLWLGFLDINVLIIIVLMLIIGIINMGSAMLVLIVVRTNFIGLMKAIGGTNWLIRKVFLVQAGFLIIRGMIYGNIIGIALCLIQKYTGLISLNAEVYYLSQVPIELDFWNVLFLNLGTLVICLSALIIPSFVITKVNPVKAIRFD
jgi:lipoprotein-releasing system permease protein